MRRLAIGFTMLLSAAGFLFAQNELQPLAVVKLHKSETITLKQLKARAGVAEKQYEAYGMKMTDAQKVELRKATLDGMIANKLIAQQAAKEGLAITDSQVNAAFVSSFSQGGQQITEAQLEQAVKKSTGKSLNEYILETTGMSVADYKAYIKESITVQQYIVSKKQDEAKKISATDKEVNEFYDINKTKFVWDDMAKLFLYVIPKGKDAEGTKAKANAALKQVSAKQASRTDIMKSSDNGKVYQAGEIMVHNNAQTAQAQGWTMDKMKELFGRSVGFTSELIDGGNNWQFYSVLNKYSAKMLKLSDPVEPESKHTVKEYIKGTLTTQKQGQFLQKAANDIAKNLDNASNVDRKKTGDALTKLLSW